MVQSGLNTAGKIQTNIFCGHHTEDLDSVECQPENLPYETFCRPLPGKIVSIQNVMTLEFRSDSTDNGNGFQFCIKIVDFYVKFLI